MLDPSPGAAVSRILELTDGVGADAVIAATNDALVAPDVFKTLRRHGYANLYGLFPYGTRVELDIEQLNYSDHKVLVSWALTRRNTAEVRSEIIDRWLILEPILTGKFPLNRP